MKNKQMYVFLLAVGVIGVLLSAWPSSSTRATAMIPPPIPTMTSTPEPTATPVPVTGSLIELQAEFPQAWPWDEAHWQELWAVVQWQDDTAWLDPEEEWRDVEGWQGTLDEVALDVDGSIVGKKTWWVAKEDLGTGPFRWLVYRSQGGRLLGVSDTFDLPEIVNRITIMEVTLSK